MEMTIRMMNKKWCCSMDRLTIAILLFLASFGLIHWMKPVLIYQPDGSLRPFGIGYRKKSVTPLWLVVFLLAIFSYTASIYVNL
jgi:hypothetical protein